MLGGALIATGAHGCLYDNMPDCKYSRANKRSSVNRTRKISKVVALDDPSTDIEISNSQVLKHIPNYEDYFILIEDWCENDERPEGWQNCSLFKPGEQRIVKFMQLRMNYGGERLYEYARNHTLLMNNWLKIQIRVAEGLRNLHMRGWVHGDLHHGNIVVDEYGVARIIDFGQSYSINKFGAKKIEISFTPEYDNYSPELDYVAGLQSGLEKLEIMQLIFTRKKILHKIDEIFPRKGGIFGDLMLFANYNDVITDSDAILYIKTYAKAADIWTLGYNFFNLYMDLLVDPVYLQSEFYKRNHGEQMQILRGMLHPDPRRRLNIDSLLKELYSLRMLWV